MPKGKHPPKKVADIGEFGLIRRQLAALPRVPADGTVGPGDDCAVIRVKKGKSLLLTTDMMVEGVHFRRDWMTPDQIGAKAMRVNLSDIAAMGGVPRYALVAVGLPLSCSLAEATGLFRGMRRIARELKVTIVGGDTNRSDQLIISITLVGEAPDNRFLTRKGAQAGDNLYVTGTLGDSALGLEALKRKKISGYRPFIQRHTSPPFRIGVGKKLGLLSLSHAMIDLSDGLAGDLRHILDESGVGSEVVVDRIPVSPRFVEKARLLGLDPDLLKLSGGEDYELLFTASPKAKIPRRIDGVPVTKIGKILPKRSGLRFVGAEGRLVKKKVGGFNHF